MARSVIHSQPCFREGSARDATDDEEVSLLKLVMVQHFRDVEVQRPLCLEKLESHMFPSHIAVLNVMAFDEGFARAPDS